MISEIVAGIENTCASELTTFAKSYYFYDLAKINLNKNKLQYVVTSDNIIETKTATNLISYLQSFSLHLLANYLQDAIDDTLKRNAIIVLQEASQKVLKQGLRSRFNVPQYVITVNDFRIDLPSIDTTSKMIYLKTTFDILYRVSL
jgi:hypothetical protein